MSTTEITTKVRELKELKAYADQITAEITAIEDTIKAEMTARGVDELQADVFTVRYKKVTSSRFDTTAFKAAMPELAKQFTKTTESTRFTVA